jgi:hypothetical protein
MNGMKHRWIILTAPIALTCLAIGWAWADEHDAKFYNQQFDQFSRIIADLKAADVTEAASRDIELVRTWISQGQAYLANDKLDQIDPILKRMEAQAEYIRIKIDAANAEEAAEEAEQAAQQAEAQANQARETLKASETKLQQLEAQGL